MKITALQETVLKKEPIQSTELPDNKLVHVIEGRVYKVKQFIREEKGHQLVELDYGAGQWYIWPPHWEGANPEKPKEYSPAVQRQIDRLSKYTDKMDLSLGVKYFSQRDNSKMPHRTCNTSSNAMYLDWLIRQTGKSGLSSDEVYMPYVFKHGDTIYHGVQTKAIKDFGFSTKWMTDRDFPFIKELLLAGFPVVCNILHRGSLSAPRGGHIIVLIDYDPVNRVYTAHDPYGTLASNYSVHNGAYSKISDKEFTIRSQGGYRILA